MISRTQHVSRVLIVLAADGTLRAAQQELLIRLVDDDTGAVLNETYGSAAPLEADALATVLPASAGLLAQVAVLTAERDALAETVEELRGQQPSAPVAGQSFVARDMIALLTPDDRIAVDRALRDRDPATGDLTARAAGMVLLWESLTAQGDVPIRVSSERFRAGWAGLSAALGETRAGEIAMALGIAAALAAPER